MSYDSHIFFLYFQKRYDCHMTGYDKIPKDAKGFGIPDAGPAAFVTVGARESSTH